MFNIDRSWIGIPCPVCAYEFEIQFIDIRLQSEVYCHNCKSLIKIRDENASAHSAEKNLSNQVAEFDELLNKFK